MSLNLFLQLLESRVDHRAVATVWSEILQEPALRNLLQPANHLATSYPDPKTGRMFNIVKHSVGDIIAVDEENPNIRISLTHEDIILHEPDWGTIRKQIASALSLQTSRSPIPERIGFLQVGNWELKKAAIFPVYVVVCQSGSDLHKIALQFISEYKKEEALLLTPTRRHWKEEITQILRSQKMLLIPMDEILEIHNGQFKSTETWTEYLDAFCQMIETKLTGNYQNKKPLPIRAPRTANTEKLVKAMEAHLLAARDHAQSLVDRGQEAEFLPRPEQKMLAKQLGIHISSVSRCINDKRAKELKILWDTANSLEGIMKYKRRR